MTSSQPLPTPPLASASSSPVFTPPPASSSQGAASPQTSSSLAGAVAPQAEHSVSLDLILAQIQNSNSLTALTATLRHAPAAALASGDGPAGLNIPNHTLGILFILSARLHAGAPVPGGYIEEFARRFDPVQARHAPERVSLLAKGIIQRAEALGNLKIAIDPLHELLTRYPPDLSYLTPLHAIFLNACITAQHPPPLSVLLTPIENISLALAPDLTYTDHLLHHYLSGIALAVAKRWAAAAEAFEICASAPVSGAPGRGAGSMQGMRGMGGPMSLLSVAGGPSSEASAVQMDAAKKLLLVQLIFHGKTLPLPKYTHGAVANVRNTPYGAFAKAYPKGAALRAVAGKEEGLFAHDGNLGLVKQAIDRAPRWAIKKLTETYLTLGLREIGRNVGIEDTEEVRRIVLSMIELGEMNATIAADGTVSFEDDAPLAVSRAQVDGVLRAAQEQEQRLRELEREMARSKEYLIKAVRGREEGPSAGGWPDEEMGAVGGWVEETVF
ncbi:hypothetical protein FA95DRAFT_1561817 [Auriscalpium vulgare]|uniref:Uncharacterized protein n=1 Tax=Auriscalpium vulgare TaxID=40419 RepID=A0ACB8RKT4_9AGAM|nr:hypothetical protein FA95DRAFT_1561817 [Auriscalpium vulgare]